MLSGKEGGVVRDRTSRRMVRDGWRVVFRKCLIRGYSKRIAKPIHTLARPRLEPLLVM